MSGDLGADVAAVLASHGIYGFNGSEVACRCSQRKWRYLLDWHTHVADALAPLITQRVEAAKVEGERGGIQFAIGTMFGAIPSTREFTLDERRILDLLRAKRDRAAALDPEAR